MPEVPRHPPNHGGWAETCRLVCCERASRRNGAESPPDFSSMRLTCADQHQPLYGQEADNERMMAVPLEVDLASPRGCVTPPVMRLCRNHGTPAWEGGEETFVPLKVHIDAFDGRSPLASCCSTIVMLVSTVE